MVPVKIQAGSMDYHIELSSENADRLMTDHKYADHLINEIKRETKHSEGSNTEKKSWSREETLALIKLIDENFDDLSHPMKKRRMWIFIAEELKSQGVMVTDKICSSKWKNLLRTYKTVKLVQKSTGRKSNRFDYLDEMEDILKDRALSQTILLPPKPRKNEVLIVNSDMPQIGADDTNDMFEDIETAQDDTQLDFSQEYLRLKQEEWAQRRLDKRKRHEEKLQLQQRRLDLEEKKMVLLEKYLLLKDK